MKNMLIASLAIALYWATNATAATFDVPAECKNLALMQTELLQTRFHNNNMGDGIYNPPSLTLKTNNGFQIGNIDYLGGDSEDSTGPNAGKYPCDLDQTLCTGQADAGGSIDWARVSVTWGGQEIAQVIVSMGSRGGCVIGSAKVPPVQ